MSSSSHSFLGHGLANDKARAHRSSVIVQQQRYTLLRIDCEATMFHKKDHIHRKWTCMSSLDWRLPLAPKPRLHTDMILLMIPFSKSEHLFDATFLPSATILLKTQHFRESFGLTFSPELLITSEYVYWLRLSLSYPGLSTSILIILLQSQNGNCKQQQVSSSSFLLHCFLRNPLPGCFVVTVIACWNATLSVFLPTI